MASKMVTQLAAGDVAPSMYRALNGVFCIHKPADVSMARVRFTIRHKLAKELSALPWPERNIVKIGEETKSGVIPVTSVPDIAHNPLVLGPRYLTEDFYVNSIHSLSDFSSGIHLVGIGAGARYIKYISSTRQIRVYHVTGELGRATSDFTLNSRTLIKTTFRHVTRERMARQLSAIQATHQRLMFEFAGVKLESEEAYRLASQGPVRPLAKSPPLIYSIKCIDFKPPHFTLEIHCVNEICDFLKQLVDLIGRDLKASALCRKIHRIRVGQFGSDYALLQKHWTAHNIIQNIALCRPLVDRDVVRRSHELQPMAGRGPSPPLLLSSADEDASLR